MERRITVFYVKAVRNELNGSFIPFSGRAGVIFFCHASAIRTQRGNSTFALSTQLWSPRWTVQLLEYDAGEPRISEIGKLLTLYHTTERMVYQCLTSRSRLTFGFISLPFCPRPSSGTYARSTVWYSTLPCITITVL